MPTLPQESDKPAGEPIGGPRQSQVAPVSRGVGEKPSETIENLLAGLGSKAAIAAMAKTGVLAKLPASHQLALRQALLAASESHKEAETGQNELAKIRKQLHQTERDLAEASLASAKRSADAAEQAFDLRQDLAAAKAANQSYESRSQRRRVYFWLALTAGMAVVVAGAFLLPRSRPSNSGSAKPGQPVILAIPLPRVPVRHTRGQSAESHALDRLDQDLAGLPLHEVSRALSKANEWLAASGAPPCTVLSIEGDTSLLVTGQIRISGGRDKPLAGSIDRCAEALEHVLR